MIILIRLNISNALNEEQSTGRQSEIDAAAAAAAADDDDNADDDYDYDYDSKGGSSITNILLV